MTATHPRLVETAFNALWTPRPSVGRAVDHLVHNVCWVLIAVAADAASVVFVGCFDGAFVHLERQRGVRQVPGVRHGRFAVSGYSDGLVCVG